MWPTWAARPGSSSQPGRALHLGLLLFYYRRAVYRDFRHVLLLALLIGAFVGGAAVVSGSGWPAELIPIAFPALVVAALWDGRMALNLSLILAILLAGRRRSSACRRSSPW